MSETTIDERGRIVIPQDIRERLDLHPSTILELKERKDEIVLKPIRKKKKGIMDFYAIKPKRTGKPKWATPEEIKRIWE